MTINPEKLAELEGLTLDHGAHTSFQSGHCAMEVVAWLADQGHTDAPACASEVVRGYTIRLNDRWDDEQRQALKPYLPRMIGTGGDGKDPIRRRIAIRAVCDLLPPWLRLAALDDHAAKIEALVDGSESELRDAIYAARSAAWAKRNNRWEQIRTAVRTKLIQQGDAVAVAAAAADAAAVADAVAAAVAVAVADAVAAAVAAASPQERYSRVYDAVRAHFREHPVDLGPITQLGDSQRGAALTLLDRLITAEEVA